MKSGEEQARVEGGGKLELQLGKKGNLSSAVGEEERSMREDKTRRGEEKRRRTSKRQQKRKGGKTKDAGKQETVKERTRDGFFEKGED